MKRLGRHHGTRIALIAICACLAWASLAPAAHAIGLPFVDLPTAGSVASDAMDAASRAIVNVVATAVASLTNEIIKVSDTVGAPQVGSNNTWFTASYKRTMGVSLYLMAIVALVAIVAAGIRGKVGDMAQVVFVGIPWAVLAMMLATVGVQLALNLTDAMTAYTFRSSIPQIQTFLHDIGTVFTATEGAAQPTAVLAPGLVLIIGLLVIVAQLVILSILIIRMALIYIVTLFLPLVFAMQVWPTTRHMTRKALELLAVLILSKFAIFTCFALGAGATSDLLAAGGANGPPPVQTAIVGFGVMIAAAFSPMLLMSIIPGIAGSFGAGMPGGTYGAGALAIKSPSQIMRSTLASVHTVRGGSHSHASASSSKSRGGSSPSTRPPTPPGGTAGAGRGSGAGAAVEQAHGAANAHPAASAAMGTTQTLAAGANAAAQVTRAGAASGTSKPTSQEPPAAAAAQGGAGPHVVSSRSDTRDGAPAASRGAPDGPRPTGRAAEPQPSTPGADTTPGADGFARVQTRQPFTLETT